MRCENPETITYTLSWCKILPVNGFNLIRAKQNLHMRRKKFFFKKKILEPSHRPKDNSMELGRACEVVSWNHRTSTPHRSETNGIAERAVRRVKKSTSAVLLKSGWDERWLSDFVECYCYLLKMSKTSWHTGKLHMKNDLENHSKGQ